jgi:hypothetical protein
MTLTMCLQRIIMQQKAGWKHSFPHRACMLFGLTELLTTA